MGAAGSTTRTKPEADLPTSSAEAHRPASGIAVTDASPDSPHEPQAGDVLKDRYVLLQSLAQWSTNRLFRAEDRQRAGRQDPDAFLTLKIVTASPGVEPAAVQALRREAAIAGGLEHPNLLRIHGVDRDGPHTFLCMEWRAAESLGAILDARGPRPMTRVQSLRILEGTCQALGHLHARRIIHGDVKPGNILVTVEGEAALVDFGVASGPGADDLPDPHGHTPEYASPEVLLGAAATAADDLFSVACVAYRMLSGQRPFGAGNAIEAEAAGARPACPAQLSPAQWRALDRALAFRRADRQPDVETFINQLKGLGDDGSTGLATATAASAVPMTDEVRSGRRSGYWPLAAGLLLVVAGGMLLRGQRPGPSGVTTAPVPVSAPAPAVRRAPARRAEEPPAAATLPAAPQPAARSASPMVTARPAMPVSPATGVQAAPVAAAAPAPVPGTPSPDPPPVIAPPPALPLPLAMTALPLAMPQPLPVAAPATPAIVTSQPPAVAAKPIVPLSSLHMRHYVEPDYPHNAAARALSGAVHLAFTVDHAGATRDVTIVDSEPDGTFDEAALAAVKHWRFEPPADDGGDVVRTEVRLVFKPID